MSSKDYKKIIMESLLKKYNRSSRSTNTNRRIILRPEEVYKAYDKNNAALSEKQYINEAVSELLELGFITADYLKFSDDIEKIYLCEGILDDIYVYMESEYGIVPQSTISKKVHEIINHYLGTGEIAPKYCEFLLAQVENPRLTIVPEKVDANLKMICFLENNKEKLYVREASMLVYGDSKWFENNNYDEICTFLRTATGIMNDEGERNDEILSVFHVFPAEQEILIKGDWKIEWEEYTLEVSKIPGGIGIASGNIQRIKRITVDAGAVMTIENKTAYQRMQGNDAALMYLGGFANRYQIDFLKKVISDNPYVKYRHFGDIDIGGFLIHKQLCRDTSKNFELYCMGIEQLRDVRFSGCLRELTENDNGRLNALEEELVYCETLKYMKENNVKLEQEIVSYYLDKE